MAWTDPKTWVASAILTAAELNQHLRDNLKAIGDPWQAYTTTWSGSTTSPSLGNGSLLAAYSQAGKLVNFRIVLTAGSTTTYGSGTWGFTLPVATIAGPRWLFTGLLRTASDFPLWGLVEGGSTAISMRRNPTTAGGALVAATQGDPTTMAAGHRITIAGTYEAL